MEKVLFIINSLLQKRSGIDLPQIISRYLDKNKFEYGICFSEFPGHATELAVLNKDKYDILITAGGDGTVNEVGKVLAGSDIIFGIIPVGSGNGLARTMKIPLSASRSIQIINTCKISHLDMGLVNGIPFFNMAGVGFDASVAHRYNKKKNRGFLSYLRSVTEIFFHYKASWYDVIYESQVHTIKAFLISFANSSQWGYNAHICPAANPSDGLLGITIMRSFPKIITPVLAWQLFTKKLSNSRYVQVFMTKQIEVRLPGEMVGHIDGDPVLFHDHIQVEVVHNAINIISGMDQYLKNY
jgi:diacylglycerol kinase (ATP)